jgi:cytochrome c5
MNKTSSAERSVPTGAAAVSAPIAAISIACVLVSCVLAGCVTGAGDSRSAERHTSAPPSWSVVKVELPVSNANFPAGDGAEVANAQCLICHSAGMVLRQPPLTQKDWIGEINKMRNAYGSPLPADQIERLAKYLFSINGGQAN